jgi:hypothetical protein
MLVRAAGATNAAAGCESVIIAALPTKNSALRDVSQTGAFLA